MAWIEPVINHNSNSFYKAEDINRVGNNVSYLALYLIELPDMILAYLSEKGVSPEEIYSLPYNPDTIEVNPKTDWINGEKPRRAQIDACLVNVGAIRSILTLPEATPETPSDLVVFGQANAIELILLAVYTAAIALSTAKHALIDNTAAAWFYSGEIYGGNI